MVIIHSCDRLQQVQNAVQDIFILLTKPVEEVGNGIKVIYSYDNCPKAAVLCPLRNVPCDIRVADILFKGTHEFRFVSNAWKQYWGLCIGH